MTGIREKKKKETQERIQESAIALFGTKGFSKTSMEDIADRSYIGVGTLYNYYRSKSDLLLSIIVERSNDFEADFQNAIKNRSADLFSTINSFFYIYLKSFSVYNKTIWREFIGNGFSHDPVIIQNIWKVDEIYTSQFLELMKLLKEDGFINADVNLESAVQTLYSLLVFHVLKYISDENLTMKDLKKSLSKQAEIVIAGIKK